MRKKKVFALVVIAVLLMVVLTRCGHHKGTCAMCGEEEKLYTVKYYDGEKHKEKMCIDCATNVAYQINSHNELYPEDKYKVKIK